MTAIKKQDVGDTKLEYAGELEKTNTTWDDTPTLDPELDRRITRKFDKHGGLAGITASTPQLIHIYSGTMALWLVAFGLHRPKVCLSSPTSSMWY